MAEKNSKTLLGEIRKLLKLDATTPPPPPGGDSGAPQTIDVKTADGKTLRISDPDGNGTPDKGDSCQEIDEAGNPSPAKDGDYTLEDGTTITTKGGVIESIGAAPNADNMPDMAGMQSKLTQMQQELGALKQQNKVLDSLLQQTTGLKLELKAQKEAFGKALELFEELSKQAPEPHEKSKSPFTARKEQGMETFQKIVKSRQPA